MKVLLCTPYDFSGVTPGGISVWAKNIVDYYTAHPEDITLDIFNCTRSRYINENTSRFKRFYYGVVDYLDFVKRIYKKAIKENYDAVHMNTTASLGCIKDIVLCKLLIRKGIRVYLHYHFGRIPRLIKANDREWKMVAKSIKLAHQSIVMDHASYIALKECGFNNVVEIPNPYSPELESLVRQSMPTTVRIKHRVLFVSRVFKQKGIYELVTACSKINDLELRIVGPYEDVDKNKLMEITDHGDWIHFIGPVKHEDVVKELLACDIFVLPTYTEGFPNVILETMLCKTPAIVTPVGAIPQMLDFDGEPCGISIRPQNVDDIVNAIENLIDNENLKTEITERGAKRVKELYGVECVCKQLYDIWRN